MVLNNLLFTLQIRESLKNIWNMEYLIWIAVLGVLIGLVIILLVKGRRKKIYHISEIENNFNLPILTVVPKYSKKLLQVVNSSTDINESIVSLTENELAQRESYRNLRTKILNIYPSTLNSIIFTSTEEGAGKTTVVANLAVSMARLGKRVLVIDCNLKSPKLARVFKIYQTQIGLGDFLTKNIKLIVSHPFELTTYKGLKVELIPAGRFREDSSEILGSQGMGELLKIAQSKYDYVLLDTPALSRMVDTFVICKMVKNAILIIRQNATPQNSVSWAIDELEQSGVTILGFVFNGFNVPKTISQYKYGYVYAKKRSKRA
jgi:capsular exopolysaccharide synthesis family protein